MSIFKPAISWEAIVTETSPHPTQYNYTCRLNKVNANDPGYGQLVVGYYVVDFIGHLFEIQEINYGGDPEVVRLYDILKDDYSYGPYNDKGSYVYASLKDAALLTQAKLNRLDESAEDFVRSLGVDPKLVNAVQFEIPYNPLPPEEEIEGLIHWEDTYNTLSLHTGYGSILQVGQEIHIKVYNDTGSFIPNGTAVYPNGIVNEYPAIGLAKSDTHETITVDYGLTTTDIEIDGYGFVSWFGKTRGLNTSMYSEGDTVYISPTTAGEITNVRPQFPNYTMQIGIVTKSDLTDGVIFVTSRATPFDTFNNFWNGVFRETIDFLVDSNGTTVTGSLSPANGHDDMTMIFSDGFTMLPTTPPATITLVPGTDTVPVENFIYIPRSTKLLTVSTTDWPTTVEHIKVASVVLKSALATQTEGALKNQNWNDAIENTNIYQGHLSHIAERLRQEPSKWNSGVEPSLTINSGPTPDDVYIATTSGSVYQLHRQVFPAQNMATGDDVHVVNDFTNPYKTTGNLNTETLSATGASLANSSFSFVLWGVQNKTGQISHLMINKPIGTYAKNDPDAAVSDANNYSVYDLPKAFLGTSFLIARFTFVLQTDGQTWSLYDTEDLRGKLPNSTAGGGGGGGVGATSFLGLTDTPASYVGNALKAATVNAGETALEFTTIPGLITFTNGLTETSGTAKLGGVLTETTTLSGSQLLLLGSGASPLSAMVINTSGGTDIFSGNPTTAGGTQTFRTNNSDGEYSNIDLSATTISMTRTDIGEFKMVTGGSGVTFQDFRAAGSRNGIEYLGDYSADYTDRSLVDKKYVDDQVGSPYTFSNGLTETSGVVKLGGTLTGYTLLQGSYFMDIKPSGFAVTTPGNAELSSGSTGVPGGVMSLESHTGTTTIINKVTVNSNAIALVAPSVALLSLNSSTGSATFQDNRAGGLNVGLEYVADYSANYSNRSLVDKEYVDGVAGGGSVTSVAAGNGMNFTTITSTGSVVLGTPGNTTSTSTNAVTSTSHTHALNTTGVTAASYTNANITVDNKGRITSASNGSSGSSDGVVSGTSFATSTGVLSLTRTEGLSTLTVDLDGRYGEKSNAQTISGYWGFSAGLSVGADIFMDGNDIDLAGTIGVDNIINLDNINGKAYVTRSTYSIGTWNMDTTGSITISHGIGLSNKILAISAIIVADDGSNRYPLDYKNNGSYSITNTQFTLTRLTGGFFDSTSFDSTAATRGYVVVDYANI